ncbi:MAG: flagellar biosynthesis protein FlgN [Pseudooceanicola sp.]|nr:flagellar biosynthesis protein FlgN [Pseudooceanicola sp.]
MGTDAAQAVIDELDQLLDQERKAVLAGDLETIARILALKETLIDRVNAIPPQGPRDLRGLTEKLSRNQALLTAAMEGIRAVADRMADLRRVRQTLETYDRTGRRNRQQTPTHGTIERRA